jgi:hypothetical protein
MIFHMSSFSTPLNGGIPVPNGTPPSMMVQYKYPSVAIGILLADAILAGGGDRSAPSAITTASRAMTSGTVLLKQLFAAFDGLLGWLQWIFFRGILGVDSVHHSKVMSDHGHAHHVARPNMCPRPIIPI